MPAWPLGVPTSQRRHDRRGGKIARRMVEELRGQHARRLATSCLTVCDAGGGLDETIEATPARPRTSATPCREGQHHQARWAMSRSTPGTGRPVRSDSILAAARREAHGRRGHLDHRKDGRQELQLSGQRTGAGSLGSPFSAVHTSARSGWSSAFTGTRQRAPVAGRWRPLDGTPPRGGIPTK